MLKNISRLEHVIGNKVYQLLCDSDSPLNDVKEAIFQFLKYIGHLEDSVKAAQEQSNSENVLKSTEVVDEPKVEAING